MSTLPEKAADTTAEQPWPVRVLSLKIQDYVERMSVTWVEGQVVQLNRRPGAKTAFLTLRDPDVDMSLSCAIRVTALDAMPAPIAQGARVVVQAKPQYWTQRGSLSMDVRQIRPVGIGELLARIEYLKQNLRAEGLFDAERKRFEARRRFGEDGLRRAQARGAAGVEEGIEEVSQVRRAPAQAGARARATAGHGVRAQAGRA